MTTQFTKAAVLAILRTPAASDTFPDMIARVEALEPVAQPETPTPGQFTTMCLAIDDVVTGRGFDVDPWQPIETAQRPPVQSPIVEAILAYWPGGFIESVYWADGWWPTAYDAERPWNEPTHWMPLPKPPGETTSAIPEEVKAYMRNALMVGGWRGEN